MAETVYFDTSVFIEMGAKKSKHAANIRILLKELQEKKARIYTSIMTVQELSVASHRRGAATRDTVGDIRSIARVYTMTKEVALTAAKREAELKDITADEESKRDRRKPLTKEQEIERICENRRRKWDCIHIATAQLLECSAMYCTDEKMQKRQKQLGLKNLDIVPPPEPIRKIKGPLLEGIT